MKKFVTSIILASLLTSVSSCGTIIHPERKGQRGGDLDVSIVILDGIGLLFFIIPGAIAYAVDFSNGTIYLPNSYRRPLYSRYSEFNINDFNNSDKFIQIKTGKNNLTNKDIEQAILENTGEKIDLINNKPITFKIDKKSMKTES
jgi:hypothetical protein